MKYAVIGGRDFVDYELLEKTLNDICTISFIISGGAKGTDQLAEHYSTENGINTMIFRPDWKKYGRGAGVVRNKKIIENSDICVAFWDGKSKGTQSSINIAKKLNIPTLIINY